MPRRRAEPEEDGRDELVTLLQIVLLFCTILVGRELGNVYSNYSEVSKLSANMQVSEEELAGFIRGVLAGNSTDLETGITFTLPSFRNVEGPVTQVPDYVRRWFISATLSAVVVQQPEVSDVEVQLWAEGEHLQTGYFSLSREKVSYLRLLNRTISLRLEDLDRFRDIVQRASERYGGEVEVTLTGRALAHVAFFNIWLPFSTTRYPLVRAPHVDYLYSVWTDADGRTIQRLSVGERSYISVHLQNPTRVHSVWENVTATVYRVGSEEPIASISKVVGAAVGSEVIYVFPFSPEEAGSYYYSLEVPGGFQVAAGQSPRLGVESS